MADNPIEYLTGDRDLAIVVDERKLYGIYSMFSLVQVVNYRWTRYERPNEDIVIGYIGRTRELISISGLLRILGRSTGPETVAACSTVSVGGVTTYWGYVHNMKMRIVMYK